MSNPTQIDTVNMLFGVIQMRLDSHALLLWFTFSQKEMRNSILNWACFEWLQNACLRCLYSTFYSAFLRSAQLP